MSLDYVVRFAKKSYDMYSRRSDLVQKLRRESMYSMNDDRVPVVGNTYGLHKMQRQPATLPVRRSERPANNQAFSPKETSLIVAPGCRCLGLGFDSTKFFS